ncbi:DNA-binding MarR family transcriptional regulator [Arthrobacter bambusae]|uniref:DNA-binding MarR family transcriptional regulator n=2 Tax=Arthrobacter bambusae TaxID=1338426 RepID=A0ABV2P105_9MICC
MAPTEIALALSASPAGTTKRVQKLLAAGFLIRKPHQTDKRSALLETTNHARDKFPALLEAITTMEIEVLKALGPESLDVLDDALGRLLSGLESPAT